MITVCYELYTESGISIGVIKITEETEEDCETQLNAYLKQINELPVNSCCSEEE